MLLSQVENEARVTVVDLQLSPGSVLRLSSMGIFPGARVRVVDNSIPDTSIIECRGTRLALGRKLSSLIMVKPLEV